MPNKDFWHGRSVFITGHTGFKGSWMTMWLQLLGARVTGYSLEPSTNPAMFTLIDAAQGIDSIVGDVENLKNLASAMQKAQPDIVIHMAAQALVRPSYDDPVGTYATNVMGTVHLLEAVRRTSSVRAVVVVTSDKCYENREWLWSYRENETLGGIDPYSNSKACTELVTQSYRDSFFSTSQYTVHGVAIATARAGNVLGGGDWSLNRLIPDFVRAAKSNETLTLRNPNAVRPWQHVLEPISGYLLLAQHLFSHGPAMSGAWNFGPNDQDVVSVGDVIKTLTNLWAPAGLNYEFKTDAANLHEAGLLKLDSSKARSALQWSPRWTLKQALIQVIAWYRAAEYGENMRRVTLQQINDYTANIN